MRFIAAVLFLATISFASDSPKFGWKKIGVTIISLDATEHQDYRMPKGRLRIGIQAEEAVFAGIATARQYVPFQGNKKYLSLADFDTFGCGIRNVIQGGFSCNINLDGAMLLIRDKRGPLTVATGGLSLLRPGMGSIAQRATKPNKIALTLFSWTCIENCLPTSQ